VVTRSGFALNLAKDTGGALHLAAVSFGGNRAVSGGGALFFDDRAGCALRPRCHVHAQ
jgi:hypothetical protein